MKLTFHGGAQSVTGAQYLIETGDVKVLVDCGMAQGPGSDKANRTPFGFDPHDIDAIFLTHAHIDHSGLIPRLVAQGFKGEVFCTPPTKQLVKELYEDSVDIISYESRKKGTEPLYMAGDAVNAINMFRPVDYEEKGVFNNTVSYEFLNAGHILGSAMIRLTIEDKIIVFSGDLGNYSNSLLDRFESIKEADYVLVESTYGGRVHEDDERRVQKLEAIIEDVHAKKGVLVIPTFALERAQELLYDLNNLVEQKKVPEMPVFIDSPLAITFTKIYKKHVEYFSESIQDQIESGDDIFAFPGLKMTKTKQQSVKINSVEPPKVVIAGSGMSNAGRVQYHERMYLPDEKSTLLIIGYQAEGTLGREILDGKPFVDIMDRHVPVHATVTAIGSYSGHPDKNMLLDWIKGYDPKRLKHVFCVQGESSQSKALAKSITDDLGVKSSVPEYRDTIEL